jgi:3-dehydroquinate synthase
MQTVRVQLAEHSYDIDIGTGWLQTIAEKLQSVLPVRHAVVITDSNVQPLYGDPVAQRLQSVGIQASLLSVPAGESSKCVAVAGQLWEQLLASGAHRQTVVIAVGGGVVGDLAGYIAASFARGIPFVQVPTTLLAQVDSSVGGKVGINLPGAKNMVGHFWQPRYVAIDTDVLQSLPDREYRAGLAEVVKYGVIMDPEFFAYLEANIANLNARDSNTLQAVVARCCQLKGDVVQDDERETTGLRAILNYGHTFGHALEAVTKYDTLLHGEAVAIGMLCASRLAERLGRISPDLTQRQFSLLHQLGLPTKVPTADRQALLDAMQHDKKVEQGKLRFILPTKLGHVELVGNISPDDVQAVWDAP